MKKIIATILALVMVLSVASFAGAADSSVIKFTGTERSDSMDCIQYNINAPFAAGDTISFEFNADKLDAWQGINVRSYSAGEKWFYVVYDGSTYKVEMKDGASRPADSDVAIADLGGGWIKVTFKSAAAGEGFFIRNEWTTDTTVDVATYVAYMDNVTVAGKTCSFGSANVVDVSAADTASLKFDDGTEFSITRSSQLHWQASIDGAASGSSGTETPIENNEPSSATPNPGSTSTPTTKTGVVSAAVIAAAAVLGGAVVLKKKEN